MFIDTTKIAVSDDAGNTIYIRSKMDFGAVSRVQGAKDEDRLIALYVANILGWEGPAFQGVPCTPENIARLDPNEPLLEKVGDKIAALNKKEGVSPLASTTAGEPILTEDWNHDLMLTPT